MREMKDSGIEWIGEIPKHWTVKNLKYIFDITSGSTPASGVSQYWDGDIKWITPADFKTNDVYVFGGRRNITGLALMSCSTQVIPDSSIIFSKRAPIGSVVITGEKMCINQGCLALVSKHQKTSVKFYYYALSILDKIFDMLGSGTTFKEISAFRFSNTSLQCPHFEEQQQIADFLDTQCSEIDATAEDIQKEISLLEDYKKSVITEAVTKGLNPDAEMKDSGVKWLPKIPKHWKVIPSKYLFANSDIRRQTGDEQLTASQKYGIITQKDYTAKENAQIVLATQGLEKWKHVEPNDFIISLRSFQGGLEMSKITGCITWHYVVLKAQKKVYHKYYKWLFKSARYINALQGTCNFIRDGQDLRFSNFALVPLFELPLEEQQQIADYLDTKCSEIDTLIADKKRQLDILTDYKKSLIYEYITGKKEVPVKDF